MLTMWYDKIVVIIIILFKVENVIEIETHNYLIHVALYNSYKPQYLNWNPQLFNTFTTI